MKKYYAIFLIFIFVSVSLFAQNDKVLLRYNIPDGKKLTYKHQGGVDLGALGNISSSEISTEEYKKNSEDGSYEIRTTYSNVQSSSRIRDKLFVDKNAKMKEGLEFIYHLSDRGNISNFVKPSLDHIKTPKVKKILQLVIDNLALEINGYYIRLPEGPVGIGDTWTDKYDIKTEYTNEFMEGSFSVITNYEVKKKKIKNSFQCFEIEERSQLTTTILMNFGQFNIQMEGEGEIRGKILFDSERGILIKLEKKMDMVVQAVIIGLAEAEPYETENQTTYKKELQKIK